MPIGVYARPATEKRFWAKVEKTETCWLWRGCLSKYGYGHFCANGRKNTFVHRYSFTLHGGQMIDGLQIDHLCRVRNCVNPQHLELVTRRMNLLRGESPSGQNARKSHCGKGHPFSGDNLYIFPNGDRACRQCRRDWNKALMTKKR